MPAFNHIKHGPILIAVICKISCMRDSTPSASSYYSSRLLCWWKCIHVTLWYSRMLMMLPLQALKPNSRSRVGLSQDPGLVCRTKGTSPLAACLYMSGSGVLTVVPPHAGTDNDHSAQDRWTTGDGKRHWLIFHCFSQPTDKWKGIDFRSLTWWYQGPCEFQQPRPRQYQAPFFPGSFLTDKKMINGWQK